MATRRRDAALAAGCAVAILLAVAVGALLLGPLRDRLRDDARQVVMRQRLHGLSHALRMYSVKYGEFPANPRIVEALGYLGGDNPYESFHDFGWGVFSIEYMRPTEDEPDAVMLYHWPPYEGGTSVLYQDQRVDWIMLDAQGSLVNPRNGAVVHRADEAG